MFNDKEEIMHYIMKHDTRIKDYDYAIPCDYTKKLRELDIDYTYFMSIYFKNGTFEVLNVNDYLTNIYHKISIDYINNFLTFNKFIEFYNLDKKEIYYIDSMLEKKGV